MSSAVQQIANIAVRLIDELRLEPLDDQVLRRLAADRAVVLAALQAETELSSEQSSSPKTR